MKKLDIARLGRGYVALLWLGAAAFILLGMRNWILEYLKGSPGPHWSDDGVSLLSVALVQGIASWGVFRKHHWSYYLSLLVSAWWVINGAYDFFALPLTGPRHWVPAMLFVLGGAALALLLSPLLRSQFPPTLRKAKVV